MRCTAVRGPVVTVLNDTCAGRDAGSVVQEARPVVGAERVCMALSRLALGR